MSFPVKPEFISNDQPPYPSVTVTRQAAVNYIKGLITEASPVFKKAYEMLGLNPNEDKSGDKLIDAISNLQNRLMYASTTIGLSEKNKALSAQNAQLLADIAKLRDRNTFLANENDRLNELCSHPLQGVFDDCIDELVNGKGQERHGQGKPFMEQPWKRSGDVYGTGFHYGQADKKLEEAQSLTTPESRQKERIGAINYIAMGILYERINANPAED